MRKVFSFKEYRDLIRYRIDSAEEKGYKSKLAEAAGCKGSYLSQVMNGSAQLTPEHAFGISSFWGLNPSETEFFMLLVHQERAGSRALKQHYAEKIRGLKQDAVDVAKTVQKDSQIFSDPALTALYFAHWHIAAIHLLLGIPGFQESGVISRRLQIGEKSVLEALQVLSQLQLAERRDGKWRLLQNDIHVPKGSSLENLAHMNWRQRAMVAQQKEEGLLLQFSALNTVAISDIPRLKEVLYDAIAAYRAIAQPSVEEELICLNIDFFKV